MSRKKRANFNYKNKYSLPKGISPKTFLKEKIYDTIISSKKKKIKMSSDEFSIPEMNEYNLLLKYNYTCQQLSQICKYYKQKVSGNKNEKIFRLYNYLKYSNHARKIQKVLRGYMVRKLFELKNLKNLKNCINDTDFLTLEEIKNIDLKQLIVIKQWSITETLSRKFYYAFNILSLWNLIENARIERKKSIENPFQTHHHNVSGFMNLLLAAKEHNVKRIVYASSSAVYGDLPLGDDCVDKVSLLSPYAVDKYAMELFAKTSFKIHQLSSIGLRFFNVYGPGQSASGGYAAVIPAFKKAIQNDEQCTIFGDGTQVRDFIHVHEIS